MAVEFALVIFLYLAVVAMGSALGRLLDTRFKLTNIAAFLARTCAGQYPLTQEGLSGCPSQLLPAAQQTYPIPSFCQPEVISEQDSLATESDLLPLRELKIIVQCSYSASQGGQGKEDFGIIGAIMRSSGGASLLQGRASMPYLIPPPMPDVP